MWIFLISRIIHLFDFHSQDFFLYIYWIMIESKFYSLGVRQFLAYRLTMQVQGKLAVIMK